MKARRRGWIEYSIIYDLEDQFKKYCWIAGLDLKTEKSSRLLKETLFWEIEGDEEKIIQFEKDYDEWIKKL
jgi:hypothetical protein